MISLQANKQKLTYAKKLGRVPVYETDDDGNIVYMTINGQQIPSETGEFEIGYSNPEEIKANINSQLHESIVRAFGVDDSSDYAQIVASKGLFDFNVGTLIWKKSEVKFKDIQKTRVEPTSADYEVRGVLDEGLTQDIYFLKVLTYED